LKKKDSEEESFSNGRVKSFDILVTGLDRLILSEKKSAGIREVLLEVGDQGRVMVTSLARERVKKRSSQTLLRSVKEGEVRGEEDVSAG